MRELKDASSADATTLDEMSLEELKALRAEAERVLKLKEFEFHLVKEVTRYQRDQQSAKNRPSRSMEEAEHLWRKMKTC